MKTQYQWLDTDAGRVLRVTNLQTKESLDIPAAEGIAKVSQSRLYGAVNNDELLVAKVVADKSGDIAAIRKWLSGESERARLEADLRNQIEYWKEQARVAAERAAMPRA